MSESITPATNTDDTPAATATYTAFCQQENNMGTTWIECVEVPACDNKQEEMDNASREAVEQCANAWSGFDDCEEWDEEVEGVDTDGIVCIGLIRGNVDIAMWDDGHRGDG